MKTKLTIKEAKDSLAVQISRCGSLEERYKRLGGAGIYAALAVTTALEKAEKAIKTDDYEQILFAFRDLYELK